MQNSELAKLSLLIKKPEDLYTAIFAADFPEKVVPKLPAQSLYITILARGLESSIDLLPMLTNEQYQRILHFDFWKKDEFQEANFWHWLETIDEKTSFKPLQKFLKAFDRSLLSLIVFRYLDIVWHEEPTEAPPGDNYYSPDKGYTWLAIKTEDEDRHRNFGKLLAFIFERDAKFFYQLIGISKLSTQLELEEEAYQIKSKELSDEGVPDFEVSWDLHASISKEQLLAELKNNAKREIVPYQINNLPLLSHKSNQDVFNQFVSSISEHSESEYEIFLSEMSLIVNAAVIYTESDFSDFDQMTLLLEQIRGAISIAIEDVSSSGLEYFEIYKVLGAQKLYRCGLTYLKDLSKQASKVSADKLESLSEENKIILEYATKRIPSVPEFYLSSIEKGQELSVKPQAYSSKKQIDSVSEFIRECLQEK